MSQQVETASQAVGLLIQAARLAQKRGVFDLEEAALLSQAVNLLVPPQQEEADEQENEDVDEE